MFLLLAEFLPSIVDHLFLVVPIQVDMELFSIFFLLLTKHHIDKTKIVDYVKMCSKLRPSELPSLLCKFSLNSLVS